MQLYNLNAELVSKMFEAPSKWAKYQILRDAYPDATYGDIAEVLYGIDTINTRKKVMFLERYGDSYRHKEKK